MGTVSSIEPGDVYEVWFRETLHEQSDAHYVGIETLKRARELSRLHVGRREYRCAQLIGYRKGERTYEKVLGHIDGKLTWVDPW